MPTRLQVDIDHWRGVYTVLLRDGDQGHVIAHTSVERRATALAATAERLGQRWHGGDTVGQDELRAFAAAVIRETY